MRLVRVQVPEFRALKDVDITFEPEFAPQVFPLGSLNGGGKSTLLQLIFMLLSIIDSEPSISLDSNLKNSYFIDLLRNLIDKAIQNKKYETLAIITLINTEGIKIKLQYIYGELYSNDSNFSEYIDHNLKGYFVCFSFMQNDSATSGLRGFINIEGDNAPYDTFDKNIISKRKYIISNIKNSIYLISLSDQSYIFSTTEERHLLFTSNTEISFSQVNKRLKNNFHNFFTYDFIDVLTGAFRLARDKDFKEKLETGSYGNHYDELEKSINRLFSDGKKIVPLSIEQKRYIKDSIESIAFKLPSGKLIYPADLSHGELKKLAIFVLLKYYEIEYSIVLMDEIENGFHPDWQRHIIDDLVEWGENNQYILATHSYELCRGVTPAHVKELEPKLLP